MSASSSSSSTFTSPTPESSPAPAPSTSSSDTLELANPTATQFTSSFSDFFTSGFPSPQTTSSSNSSAGDGGGGNNNNPTNLAASSSLYLFTFLATLLLLLAISCAIVIRSFIIRRRFHRRVQEALAEGIVLTPPPGGGPGGFGAGGPGGRRRIDFGEKPKMWDAHLGSPEVPSKETGWDSFLPVSARILSHNLTGGGQQLTAPAARPRSTFFQAASFGLVNGPRRWHPPFFRSRSPNPSQAPTSSPTSANPNASVNNNAEASLPSSHPESARQPESNNAAAVLEDARLQVSVLIAMPSPYRPRAWFSSSSSSSSMDDEHGWKGKTRSLSGDVSTDGYGYRDDEEELPDVVLGTAEVPWKVAVPSSAPSPDPAPGPGQAQAQDSTSPTGAVGRGREHLR